MDERLAIEKNGALACEQGDDSDDEYFSELSPRISTSSILARVLATQGIDETIDAALYAGYTYVCECIGIKKWFQSEGQ